MIGFLASGATPPFLMDWKSLSPAVVRPMKASGRESRRES